jgi:AraC-like DNA-binding protein
MIHKREFEVTAAICLDDGTWKEDIRVVDFSSSELATENGPDEGMLVEAFRSQYTLSPKDKREIKAIGLICYMEIVEEE